MRILAGGPSRITGSQRERLWRVCLTQQRLPEGVTVDFRAIGAAGDGYEVQETTHDWSMVAVQRVAHARQRMLTEARAEGYDAVWMVDDDVLCGPNVLAALIGAVRAYNGPAVAFGVFWTPGWHPEDPSLELPQVWDRHPYGVHPDTLAALRGSEVRRVAGGGACSLIFISVAQMSVYWPPLLGVEHWWEDRWACLRWAARGVPMLAVPGLRIHHAYGEAQRKPEAVTEAMHRLWGEG